MIPLPPRDLWRISNRKSLSGKGGLRYAARWHSVGRPIVYLAESPAGAMLEVLVHLELEEDALPRSYTLLRVQAPKHLAIDDIRPPSASSWKSNHALTRELGDGWWERRATALARVPSAILPNTFNYLLNPLHPDAGQITIAETIRGRFDLRLLKRLRG